MLHVDAVGWKLQVASERQACHPHAEHWQAEQHRRQGRQLNEKLHWEAVSGNIPHQFRRQLTDFFGSLAGLHEMRRGKGCGSAIGSSDNNLTGILFP